MSEIANHFYRETADRLTGIVGASFKRQQAEVLMHIDGVIKSHGPQEAAHVMHNLVEFAQSFSSPGEVHLGTIFSAIGELRTEGIEPGSAEFHEQVNHMMSDNLIPVHKAEVQAATPGQRLAADMTEALQHHRQELRRARGPHEDERQLKQIEHTIARLEAGLQQLNPNPVPPKSAPDVPQKSPEALARQVKEDARLQASFDRYDKQQAGLPVDDEPWLDDDYDEED